MKASVTLEPNIGKLGLSSLIDDGPHECLAVVQGKGSDMDLVALKTRFLEELVPVRRDESECVMTAVPRSCFAQAPLFQKSDPSRSEIRKKRNLFFFVSPFFHHFTPFFDQNAKTTFLIKTGAFCSKNLSFFFSSTFFPFSQAHFIQSGTTLAQDILG